MFISKTFFLIFKLFLVNKRNVALVTFNPW